MPTCPGLTAEYARREDHFQVAVNAAVDADPGAAHSQPWVHHAQCFSPGSARAVLLVDQIPRSPLMPIHKRVSYVTAAMFALTLFSREAVAIGSGSVVEREIRGESLRHSKSRGSSRERHNANNRRSGPPRPLVQRLLRPSSVVGAMSNAFSSSVSLFVPIGHCNRGCCQDDSPANRIMRRRRGGAHLCFESGCNKSSDDGMLANQ